jgi:hypothetical protein
VTHARLLTIIEREPKPVTEAGAEVIFAGETRGPGVYLKQSNAWTNAQTMQSPPMPAPMTKIAART